MDFSLHDDHIALRDAVQRFCDDAYPAQHRGQPEAAPEAQRRLHALAELGLLGLPFGADVGGSEQGAVEVMLVAQELGRALGGGAFVASTVMAGELITRLGSATQKREWLPAMAQGEWHASVAVHEADARYDWQQVRLTARPVAAPGGAAYRLDGRKTGVLHGDSAGLVLVLARTGGEVRDRAGLTLLAVDAATPGVTVRGYDTLDGRRAAHLDFDNAVVPAHRVLGAPGEAADAMESALDAGIAALCAEAAGAVEALLAHTADHLRTRKQFGAPLAKFQVLQHRVADMAIALEQLKSMACAAAMAVAAGEPVQRRRLVSAAKVLAGQLGRKVGLDAIQLHGGMGMTDECRVGHYAKRLIVIGQTLGDAAWHLQRVTPAR
jgi:pimeloyl-CoA dehydrogenase